MKPKKELDLFAEAHSIRAEIMRGAGGRGAQTRLAACNAILENVSLTLEGMSDAELHAYADVVATELERREAKRAAKLPRIPNESAKIAK